MSFYCPSPLLPIIWMVVVHEFGGSGCILCQGFVCLEPPRRKDEQTLRLSHGVTGETGGQGGAGADLAGSLDNRADRRTGRPRVCHRQVHQRRTEVLHRVPQGGAPQVTPRAYPGEDTIVHIILLCTYNIHVIYVKIKGSLFTSMLCVCVFFFSSDTESLPSRVLLYRKRLRVVIYTGLYITHFR